MKKLLYGIYALQILVGLSLQSCTKEDKKISPPITHDHERVTTKHRTDPKELPQVSYKERKVATAYGTFFVHDPLFWELIQSPIMQRIKHIQQYGISYYIDPTIKEYTRFDHSVGVWALLRKYGLSRQEQLAGLLHDASHTVFSHNGDYLFKNHLNKDSYQDGIHSWYLEQQQLDKIIEKYGLSLEKVSHKNSAYTALEKDLPDICADRIEYNIQEGFMSGLLSLQEVPELLKALKYENNRWFFTDPIQARKLARISLYGSEYQWGGPNVCVTNIYTTKLLKHALNTGIISHEDVHFSIDRAVWDQILQSKDLEIIRLIEQLKSAKAAFKITDEENCDTILKTKFRGIDPWVQTGDNEYKRLTELDPVYQTLYKEAKKRISNGWPIQFIREESNKELVATK